MTRKLWRIFGGDLVDIGDHTAHLNGASNMLVTYKDPNRGHVYIEENDKRNLQCHPPSRNKTPRPIIKGQWWLIIHQSGSISLGVALEKGPWISHEAGFLPTQQLFSPENCGLAYFQGKLSCRECRPPKFWYQKTPKRRHTYHLPYQLKQVVKHQHETPGSFPRSPFLQWKTPVFLSVVYGCIGG